MQEKYKIDLKIIRQNNKHYCFEKVDQFKYLIVKLHKNNKKTSKFKKYQQRKQMRWRHYTNVAEQIIFTKTKNQKL